MKTAITPQATLSAGREESRMIRRYLEALQIAHSLSQDRSVETVQRELQAVRLEIVMGEAGRRAQLAKERITLEAELEALAKVDELEALEEGFVACAGGYSAREGITREAWLAAGIEPEVLNRAGIPTR